MKRLLLTMTALAGLAAAAPAAAQYSTQVWSGVDIRNRIASLENRLSAGISAGVISRTEQGNLRVQLDNLRRLHGQYSFNGFTLTERRDLQTRLLATRDQMRYADNGRFDRDARFAWMAPGRPAYGQTGGHVLTAAEFRNRIDRLELRLNAGIQTGVISRGEELTLRRQVASLRQLERQYSYNGLSWQERENLTAQVRTVRQNINYADNGRFDRDTRYSWYEPGYGQGYSGQGYYGMGGPIEEVDSCRDRTTGIAGVFSNVFGRSCLRVGELANRNMYAVPFAYRNQYMDTPYVYYRYDGDLIYAIDTRTGRVVSSVDVE